MAGHDGLSDADRRLDEKLDAALEAAGVPPGADLFITDWAMDFPPGSGVVVERVKVQSTPGIPGPFHDLYEQARKAP